MILFQVARPHTLGVVYSHVYDSFSALEPVLDDYIERKCDEGWQATEFRGSSSECGAIELVHDDIADSILVRWQKVKNEKPT